MKIRPQLSFLFLIALVFFSAGSLRAQEKWTSVRSANFNLIGNASEKDVRRVATKLEQFREVLSRLFPTLKYNSPVPTTVVVFRNEKTFRPFKPVNADGKVSDWVAGYFRPGDDGNYIVLSVEGERQQTYQTIFHEYVHYVVSNTFGRSKIPPWFNEGIAEYYDQFSITGDIKVQLGGLNNNHLVTLQNSKLIPFDQFLKIDYFSLNQQGGHGANIFYAQSWALMHMLLHGKQGNKSEEINQYLSAVLRGATPDAAFKQAFKIEYAQMERDLKNYVEQRSFKGLELTLKEKLSFDEQIEAKPMALADANAVLGDVLLGGRRYDEAEALLAKALEEDPTNLSANTYMSQVKISTRKFNEARGFISAALKHPDAGYLVHYRYAYLLSREGMDENNFIQNYKPETATEMRAALARSIALRPDFPESYRLLAWISIVNNDQIDESIGHLQKALQLSPGNEYYRLDMADLYLRKDEFDKARSMAREIFDAAQEPAVRQHANYVIQRADMMEQNAAAIKASMERQGRGDEFRPGQRMTIVVEGPEPTEEELKAMMQEAEIKSLNNTIRRPQEGEVRVFGHLSQIACKGPTPIFSVKADGATIALTSNDFQSLMLMAYTPIDDLQIGCDSIKSDIRALVIYRPEPDKKLKTEGNLVSIELVPEYFRLNEEQ
ncbi:MAG TPA: tetratricopeptide repeat protein [Pyrinomonadaceae bacterium]|nr:tetratricopeptide repeat protein [Pyrinomonadaceae bacterium]